MNAAMFKHKEIADIILRSFYEVYNETQLINYLKATNIEVGLLLNFGRKPEFKGFGHYYRSRFTSDDQRRSAAE